MTESSARNKLFMFSPSQVSLSRIFSPRPIGVRLRPPIQANLIRAKTVSYEGSSSARSASWLVAQGSVLHRAFGLHVPVRLWRQRGFHLGSRRLGSNYAMPGGGPGWNVDSIVQIDFRGPIVFQHRFQDNWRLVGNRSVDSLANEELCFQFIRDLVSK